MHSLVVGQPDEDKERVSNEQRSTRLLYVSFGVEIMPPI